MVNGCYNCKYVNCDIAKEPCSKCRNSEVNGSSKYDEKPFLWEQQEDHNDPVNHPSHYNKGKIEVWDFVADQKLNFDLGSAIKYICRAGEKDPTKRTQDLKKAIEFVKHEIKMSEGE